MTYDDTYLYIAAVVIDENHYTPGNGTAVWDGDYMEFDYSPGSDSSGTIESLLTRHRVAFGVSNSGKDFAYTAATPYYSASYGQDSELPTPYAVSRDKAAKTTTYEGALKWKDLDINLEGKVPEEAYFMFQFGIGHSDYANLSDYTAYLGVLRFACKVPAGVFDNSAKIGLHRVEFAERVMTAEEKLADALKKIEELEKAQNDLTAEKNSLKSNLDAANGKIAELEDKVADFAKDLDAANGKVTELEGKAASLEAAKAALETEKAALQAELDKPHECTYQTVMWALAAVAAAAAVVIIILLKKKKA